MIIDHAPCTRLLGGGYVSSIMCAVDRLHVAAREGGERETYIIPVFLLVIINKMVNPVAIF